MTFTHDDIQDRLIEFLYGELEGEARVAFDAHLAGCERCRADVAELQRTRAVARAAVRADLEQPVPAGVRARILDAAATATNALRSEQRAVRADVEKPAARKGESAGPFAWLRARWAVPMFVTAAAMGALLLVRETIYREARNPLGETAAPESSVTPASGPGSGSVPAAVPAEPAAPAEQPKSERHPVPATGGLVGASGAHAAKKMETKAKAAKPKVAVARASREPSAPAPAKGDLDSLLSGVGRSKATTQAWRDDDGLGGVAADKADTRGFAQPPPARAVAAPRAPAPLAPPPPTASSAMDDESPRMMQKQQERKRAPSAEREAAAEGAAATAAAPVSAPASADGEEDRAPDAAAPLAARAEKLMASRQWAEAATAYRQLIARFPHHEQVPNWRRRLAVVEAAIARTAPPSK